MSLHGTTDAVHLLLPYIVHHLLPGGGPLTGYWLRIHIPDTAGCVTYQII